MLYLSAQQGSASMTGGQWEAVVEGPQHFEYSEHGDLAQDAEDYHPYNMDCLDEYSQQPQNRHSHQQLPNWAPSLGPCVAGPVSMRRTVSRSSARSSKSATLRASSHKTRPRIQTSGHLPDATTAFAAAAAATTTPSASTTYSLNASNGFVASSAGNDSVASEMMAAGSASPSLAAYYQQQQQEQLQQQMQLQEQHPDGSLVQDARYLPVYGYGTADGSGLSYSADLAAVAGLGHVQPHGHHAYPSHQQHQQAQLAYHEHVDPTCTQMQMDLAISPSAVSPQTSFSSSSRRSSPDLGGEDTWSLPVAASPAGSHDSGLSTFAAQLEANDYGMSAMQPQPQQQAPAQDPSPFQLHSQQHQQQQKRSVSEGESARDHELYKAAALHADGLYHCPWEGKDNCNHKPEKLKCNYDKFVDSHLKPYRCKHSSCENARFSSTACLLRHEREAHAMHGHGDKPYLCPYQDCERARAGSGFPRQWNLKDHMRRVHRDDGSLLSGSSSSSSGGSASYVVESTLPVPAPVPVPVAVVSSSHSSSSSSQAVAKGRKRKKEVAAALAGGSSSSSSTSSSSSSSSSRKSSTSSKSSSSSSSSSKRAAAEREEAARQARAAEEAARQARAAEEEAAQAQAHAQAVQEMEKAMHEWYQHKSVLSGLVQSFAHPNDPDMQQKVQSAQFQLEAMSRISSDIGASAYVPTFQLPG